MTETKRWYQSKTNWIGIAAILLAGYLQGVETFNWPDIPPIIMAVLGGLGITFRNMATKVIAPPDSGN